MLKQCPHSFGAFEMKVYCTMFSISWHDRLLDECCRLHVILPLDQKLPSALADVLETIIRCVESGVFVRNYNKIERANMQ